MGRFWMHMALMAALRGRVDHLSARRKKRIKSRWLTSVQPSHHQTPSPPWKEYHHGQKYQLSTSPAQPSTMHSTRQMGPRKVGPRTVGPQGLTDQLQNVSVTQFILPVERILHRKTNTPPSNHLHQVWSHTCFVCTSSALYLVLLVHLIFHTRSSTASTCLHLNLLQLLCLKHLQLLCLKHLQLLQLPTHVSTPAYTCNSWASPASHLLLPQAVTPSWEEQG